VIDLAVRLRTTSFSLRTRATPVILLPGGEADVSMILLTWRICIPSFGVSDRSKPLRARASRLDRVSRSSYAKSSDLSFRVRLATEQDPVEKEAKTDAELEDMILQRLVIGGVFVSVRRDPILGWRPTVVTAPKHTRNAQELADKIAAELRKKFTLKD
jgi:hypothetical protein